MQKINISKIIQPKKKSSVNFPDILKPRQTLSALEPNHNSNNQTKKLKVIKVKNSTGNVNKSEILSPGDVSQNSSKLVKPVAKISLKMKPVAKISLKKIKPAEKH